MANNLHSGNLNMANTILPQISTILFHQYCVLDWGWRQTRLPWPASSGATDISPRLWVQSSMQNATCCMSISLTHELIGVTSWSLRRDKEIQSLGIQEGMERIVDIFQGLLPLIDAACNRDEFARLVVLKWSTGKQGLSQLQSRNPVSKWLIRPGSSGYKIVFGMLGLPVNKARLWSGA